MTCPECGANIAGGQPGCQVVWDGLAARALGDFQVAAVRDLAFDTYCMQHIEPYCRSVKSYAAHLTRLCCGVEYEGGQKVYASIQKWLNGKKELVKPPVLSQRGRMTILDVISTPDGLEHQRLVRTWAALVWEAYASQQAQARAWIQAALDAR